MFGTAKTLQFMFSTLALIVEVSTKLRSLNAIMEEKNAVGDSSASDARFVEEKKWT